MGRRGRAGVGGGVKGVLCKPHLYSPAFENIAPVVAQCSLFHEGH